MILCAALFTFILVCFFPSNKLLLTLKFRNFWQYWESIKQTEPATNRYYSFFAHFTTPVRCIVSFSFIVHRRTQIIIMRANLYLQVPDKKKKKTFDKQSISVRYIIIWYRNNYYGGPGRRENKWKFRLSCFSITSFHGRNALAPTTPYAHIYFE